MNGIDGGGVALSAPERQFGTLWRAAVAWAARLRPDHAYWLLFALLFGYLIASAPFAGRGVGGGQADIWHHVAVIRELIANPFAPSNPHLPTDEGSRFFTPWSLLLALLARLGGFDAWTAFGLGASITLLTLGAGIHAFGRAALRSDWAPLALLAALVGGWSQPLAHTGSHHPVMLALGGGYPATFAIAAQFLLWAAVVTGLRAPRLSWLRLTGIVAGVAALAVIHLFAALLALGVYAAFVLFTPGVARERRLILLAAAAIGVLLAAAWPYFNPLATLASASDPRWSAGTSKLINDPLRLLGRLGFGAAGLFGLWLWRERRWDAPLAMALGGLLLAYATLTLLNHPVAHRLPAMVILLFQIGLASLLVQRFATGGKVVRGFGKVPRPALEALMGVFVILQAGYAWAIRAPGIAQREAGEDLLSLIAAPVALVPAGAIAFATDSIVYPYQSTGRRVVSIPRPEPEAPSLPARQAANDRFFTVGASTAERRALAARWGATYAIYHLNPKKPRLAAELRALGPARRFAGDIELVRIAPGPPR